MAHLTKKLRSALRRPFQIGLGRLPRRIAPFLRSAAPIGGGVAALLLSVHVAGEVRTPSTTTLQNVAERDLTLETRNRLDKSCTLCHEINPVFSHPVGIAPKMAVPSDLPLIRGAVGCLTCHESESGRAHVNAPLDNVIRLRAEMGQKELCAKCHDPYGIDQVDAHAASISRAHLQTTNSRGYGDTARDRPARFDRPIVDGKENCLSCHDGSIASDVGHSREGSSGSARFQSSADSHPIGIEYRLTKPRDADGLLRPASELDSHIRLIDNKVSCRSCHSQYSRRPNHLVMSNDRSALCLGCHMY